MVHLNSIRANQLDLKKVGPQDGKEEAITAGGMQLGIRKGDSFFRKNDIQTDEFREARYGRKSDCNKWTSRGLPEKREMASGEASEAEKRRRKFPVDETGKIV